MDLDEILAKLLEKFNADKAAVLAALKTKVHPLYQMAFDAGHSVATAAKGTELETANAALLAATAAREKAEKDLRDYQAKQPDVATVTKQFQDQIAALTRKHEDALKVEREARTLADQNRVMADLQIRLGRRVKPIVAKLLVQDKDVRDRVKVKPDGSYEVMQAGKAIPFSPAEGKEALDLLADELTEKQDADMRLADGDEGSGVHNSVPSGGGAKGGDTFTKIRDRKKAEVAEKQKAPASTLEEKLGMVAR